MFFGKTRGRKMSDVADRVTGTEFRLPCEALTAAEEKSEYLVRPADLREEGVRLRSLSDSG